MNLDPNAIEDGGFAEIEDGKYIAIVANIDDEERTSAKGNTYCQINVCYEIIAGGATGRKVYARYIYDHPSEKACAIGQQGIKQLWSAQGADGPMDTDNLSRPVPVQIVLKTKDEGEYGMRQNVVGVNRCDKKLASNVESRERSQIEHDSPAGSIWT